MFPETDVQWHIGCPGFYYKEWKEIFYPKGLAPKNWYQKSPPAFTFSVKAPKLITHYKVFNETESLLRDFYDTIREGLQEKLGPVLSQFFSNVHYSETLLSRIIVQLDPSFVNVLEFRHASWWN